MRQPLYAIAAALLAVAIHGPAAAGEGTAPPPATTAETLIELVLPQAAEPAIAQSYVVMIEPGTDIAALARAWALLRPDLSRASPPMTVFEMRLDSDFPADEVLPLLRATRGVVQAEANFAIPLIQGGAITHDGAADGPAATGGEDGQVPAEAPPAEALPQSGAPK